ncbi:hypothetical protein V8E55_007544 [Tylopilus felleus]
MSRWAALARSRCSSRAFEASLPQSNLNVGLSWMMRVGNEGLGPGTGSLALKNGWENVIQEVFETHARSERKTSSLQTVDGGQFTTREPCSRRLDKRRHPHPVRPSTTRHESLICVALGRNAKAINSTIALSDLHQKELPRELDPTSTSERWFTLACPSYTKTGPNWDILRLKNSVNSVGFVVQRRSSASSTRSSPWSHCPMFTLSTLGRRWHERQDLGQHKRVHHDRSGISYPSLVYIALHTKKLYRGMGRRISTSAEADANIATSVKYAVPQRGQQISLK